MNNEIKEILEKLKDENNYQVDCNDGSAYKELFANEIQLLLDYITNLQEENKRLKEENQEMKTNTIPTLEHNIDALVDEVDELEDYQSRIDKAIEYIRSNEWSKDYEISSCRNHLLNILGGE